MLCGRNFENFFRKRLCTEVIADERHESGSVSARPTHPLAVIGRFLFKIACRFEHRSSKETTRQNIPGNRSLFVLCPASRASGRTTKRVRSGSDPRWSAAAVPCPRCHVGRGRRQSHDKFGRLHRLSERSPTATRSPRTGTPSGRTSPSFRGISSWVWGTSSTEPK